MLRAIFADPHYFAIHPALPAGDLLGDEGAANHTRFSQSYDGPGVHLFVYGRSAMGRCAREPTRFPARQTLESVEALARRHGLNWDQVVFAQQSPEAIDAGVFHNDVISVGNLDCFFYHEAAFVEQERVLQELSDKFSRHCGGSLKLVEVKEDEVSLEDIVKTYLFNSQLVQLDDGMALIAPSECEAHPQVQTALQRILGDANAPID